MTITAKISFNEKAHADYASQEITWTGLWSVDFNTGGCFMINKRLGDFDPDDVMLFPWYCITRVTWADERPAATS